jgi:hypothetical protein
MEIIFNYSPWYMLLVVVLAAFLSWLLYQGSKDLLPRPSQLLLGLFRFLVLSLIGLLLLEPLLNARSKVSSLPIVAVLQDASESIVVQKDSAFARNEYPGQLQQMLQGFDPQSYSVDYYSFSSELDLNASPDSLQFTQTGTDISAALSRVQKLYQNQNLGAIVLVSDGINTQGVNPLFVIDRFQQPVHTVLLGDTTPQRDLQISEVLFNEIAYLNNEMPIRVKVRAEGFQNAEVKVSLRGEGKILGTQSLKLGKNKLQGQVDFLIEPKEVGVQQYRVEISRQQGEITYRNNQKRIFVNVLETRRKIALFAGSPHPDLGALRQAFKRDDRYELREFIHRSPTEYYTDPTRYDLGEFDLLILHNYPNSGADKAMVNKIGEEIEKRKVPVIHFVGAFTDLNALKPLYKYMAITPKNFNPKSEEVIANFSRKYRDHSTFTFGEEWLRWANSAPPIFRNRSSWEAKSDAEVFATARIKNIALDYPVYALQSQLNRKNMVFLGENFWRMRAHAYLEAENFDYFDDWLFNNIKWLSVNDDKRKFKVDPSKRLYTGNEPVQFRGQAYDDSYNPIPGVEIKLSLTDPEGKENIYYLNETGQSQYYLELYNLQEGTYRYVAEGKKDEVPVGSDKGQFSVGQSNIEHLRLQADRNVMQQLALRTGGEFTFARNLDELADKIKADPGLKPTVGFKEKRQDFHHFTWILILMLSLLSVEWVVRKLYSLI